MYEVTNWNLKHRWSKVVENKNIHVSKQDNIKNKKNFDRRILRKKHEAPNLNKGSSK